VEEIDEGDILVWILLKVGTHIRVDQHRIYEGRHREPIRHSQIGEQARRRTPMVLL
jgi:hypothetical protein